MTSQVPTPLREQVAALTYQDLQTRFTSVRQALASAEEQQDALAQRRHNLSTTAHAREQALLLEHGGTLPASDPELEKLKAEEADTRRELLALPEQIEKLREVRAVLQHEMQVRAVRLDNEAKKRCDEQWKGKSEQYIQAARRVIAEAALAYTRERTENPINVGMAGFIEGFIHPLDVQVIFREMAENEMQDARKYIIKQDRKLG